MPYTIRASLVENLSSHFETRLGSKQLSQVEINAIFESKIEMK